MHSVLQTHQNQLRDLARSYGVSRLRVFGSMARDDASGESDVDLLLDDAKHLTGFQLGAFQMDAQELLGRKVDLLTVNALHPMIRDRVLSEAISIE
jgi:predicted nucleotidyltransferase